MGNAWQACVGCVENVMNSHYAQSQYPAAAWIFPTSNNLLLSHTKASGVGEALCLAYHGSTPQLRIWQTHHIPVSHALNGEDCSHATLHATPIVGSHRKQATDMTCGVWPISRKRSSAVAAYFVMSACTFCMLGRALTIRLASGGPACEYAVKRLLCARGAAGRSAAPPCATMPPPPAAGGAVVQACTETCT